MLVDALACVALELPCRCACRLALSIVDVQPWSLVLCLSLVDALVWAALGRPCRCACRLALSMVE